MKKIIATAVSLSMLFSLTGVNATAETAATPVDVESAVYEQLLNREGCDSNEDGIVTEEECRALKDLVIEMYDVTDISWIEMMDSLEFLVIYGGNFEDMSIISSCDNLKFLALRGAAVTDISFIRDMGLEACQISDMDHITDQQKIDIMRFDNIEVQKGYTKVAGALPRQLFSSSEVEILIEDTSIASFDRYASNSLMDMAAAVYGKTVGTTEYSVSIKGNTVFKGSITVTDSEVYSPELNDIPSDSTEFYDSDYYSSEKVVLMDDTLYGFNNGILYEIENNVKAYNHDYFYDETREYLPCDTVLFNDGTIKVNGQAVSNAGDLKFREIGDACCITEDGDIYCLRKENGQVLLDFVYSGFESFIEGSSMFFVSTSGEVILKELKYIDNAGISYQAFETGITDIISNCNNYFVDSENILWYVYRYSGKAPNIVKKADDVVFVGYKHYNNGSVYGCVHITSDGTVYDAGTTEEVTLYEKTEMTEHYKKAGNFEINYQGIVIGDEYLFKGYGYHISLDDVLYMSYNGQQSAVSDVESIICCELDDTTGGLIVNFLRTDGSVWSYSFDNDKYTEISANTVSALIGDVNSDGLVDSNDVVHLNDYLLQRVTYCSENADMNYDGYVDCFDLVMLRQEVQNKQQSH